MTNNFNLRKIPPTTMALLKKKAIEQKTSVNSLLLKLVEQGLGIIHLTKKPVFHDLDYLAGTWNDKEAQAFETNIKSFEKIDKELWHETGST